MSEISIPTPKYFIGVDPHETDTNTYCLIRRVGTTTEVLLPKVIRDENIFEEEVENLSKYFNAKEIRFE